VTGAGKAAQCTSDMQGTTYRAPNRVLALSCSWAGLRVCRHFKMVGPRGLGGMAGSFDLLEWRLGLKLCFTT
jgi:hypothetical protein